MNGFGSAFDPVFGLGTGVGSMAQSLRIRGDFAAGLAIDSPHAQMKLSGVGLLDSSHDFSFARDHRDLLPVLLPSTDELGRRRGADRWGLDYRKTFRRRRDAIRAIRKGLA